MTRWVYNEEEIPDGWTVEPTSIKDDFGTLRSWAHQCDRIIDRGIPTHTPIFDTFATEDDDSSVHDLDRRPQPSLPDRVEGASIPDRANRYGHNW
jgi:hypothetical protein